MNHLSRYWVGGLVGMVLLVSGCRDSPITPPEFEEVAGIYNFSQLTFVPDAGAISRADVLDTLVVDQTNLELTGAGQFLLTYRFVGGERRFVSGEFSLTAARVRLQAHAGTEPLFNAMLLNSPLVLERSTEAPRLLEGSIRKQANLAAFSERYSGVPPVQGTLLVRLEQAP